VLFLPVNGNISKRLDAGRCPKQEDCVSESWLYVCFL